MKLFKLCFFFCAFLTSQTAYSQPGNTDVDNRWIKEYNAWLEHTGLDQLLSAVSVKDTLITPKGQPKAYPVKALLLRNSIAYPDAKALAQDWQEVKKSFDTKGISIYNILLLKFSSLADVSPDSLLITIRSARPKIFSVEIFFHHSLVSTEHGLLEKQPFHAFVFDVDRAMNYIMQGYFRTQGAVGTLKTFLEKELRAFFNNHNHKDQIQIHEEDYGPYNFRLKATNIYRHITQKNYHEIVYLDVSITPLTGNQIEVRFFADAVYNSGIVSPPADESSYRNIIKDFPQEIHNYNQTLSDYFNNVIYKKYERGLR